MAHFTNTATGSLVPRDDSFSCLSQHAQDYYGLGVRLGIYFIWLSGYIANTLLPSEFHNASNTNTIFVLTLLIAMANDARTGALSAIDGLVLMHLCGGTVFGVLSIWGYRTRMYHDNGHKAIRMFGGFATHVKMFVSLGVSIFGLWFWLYGVVGGLQPMGPDDGASPPNPPECEPVYTFFFAKISATGPIRYYYIVICSSCIAYFGVQVLVSSLAGWVSIDRVLSFVEFSGWAKNNRERYATGLSQKELDFLFKGLRVLNLVWLLFCAITVECTLNFNHVYGVLGGPDGSQLQLPGQLLPFLIGTFSFVTLLYLLLQEKVGHHQPRRAMAYNNIQQQQQERHQQYRRPETPTTPLPASHAAAPDADVRFDSLEIVEPDPATPGGGGGRGHPGMEPIRQDSLDPKERGRPTLVRYLVAWLPWLGVIQHSSSNSRVSTMLRQSTGLSELSKIHETAA